MVRELPQALQLGKDLPQVLQLGKDQFPDLVKYKQGRRQLHHPDVWTRLSTSSAIVTTGLDNIEALDPRSVFPGGSRKFLQFPIFPKVGPKLGEQRRTQVSTSASSGDLQPPLGEELRAPSGARPACCPPLQLAVLRSLGERRYQVPGVPPAILGDHAYHQVPLFPNCVVPAASIPAVACSSMPHCPGVLLQQLGRLPCNAHDGYAYHCI